MAKLLTASLAAVMLTVSVPAAGQGEIQTSTVMNEYQAAKTSTKYVTKTTYSYTKKNGKMVKSKKLTKGTKITVISTEGKYYKLSDGKYIAKANVGSKRINWTDTKYSKALTRYVKSANTKVYKEALSGSKSTKTLDKGTKVTIVAKTNSGYYKLKDGGYIKTSSVSKTKPSSGSSSTSSSETTSFTPSGKAGTVKFLGYYDITIDAKGNTQSQIFESPTYGGKIEWISSSAGAAYFERLGMLIASDDSPDLVTFEPLAYPNGMSKNMFTKLDKHIDINDALWKDMKDIIAQYTYNGSNYYFPHAITTKCALNYNRNTIRDAGLKDPYTLYQNGEWTWDAWRDMMAEFCAQDEDNIGVYTVSTVMETFINTTGTNIIDVTSKGKIKNNLKNADVTRSMNFLAQLGKDGLLYPADHPFGDWVSPQMWATLSDKMLFLAMEPEWTYTAATETVQNLVGVENDIHDTVSNFAFVPLPKDPESDKYNISANTFGYMIPKGAKNVKGAVEFINLNRSYETDKNIQKQVKMDSIAPETITYTTGKYAGMQKWRMTWDEKLYDLKMDMCDPSKFTFVFDDMYGINDELSRVITDAMYNSSFGSYYGVEDWAQQRDEITPIVDGIISEFNA